MKKWIEKNKILILIIFSLLLIAIIGGIFLIYINNKQKLKIQEIHMDNYSMKYDSTWEVKEKSETELKLYHKQSNSELNIIINELEDEIQYKTTDEIFNSLLANIQKQNKEYRLLNKEEIINKTNLKGYKILFENDSHQVMICIYKQGSRVVVITYEAAYEYFDIVLDSANYIIENFSLHEQKFDVQANINLKTEPISYTKEKMVQDLLKGEKQEEIANSNYKVNYTVPTNFTSIEKPERNAYYTFEGLGMGKHLTASVNISNDNIYEYLDKESIVNIYDVHYYLNDDIKVTIDKYSEEPLAYIYKDSYKVGNILYENIELIFEINADHIFTVSIKSTGVGIPKELIDLIKINNIENYASTEQT